ncbi:hypothetical protein [Micromonospora sp. WMMD998]|uniref:hypothetical protein n=1 Tax=Micromonospora sp. WMMD998 TaxID=3016092 RepID=UPI00249BE9EE|nr:hypothetical protein [Micromonospora sp. WMMD998]WFE39357.1 hypothetical protein O7619_13375 [Micromonospora sp. WMMD998]
MNAYPIVRSEHLDPPASRGMFGLGRKRREAGDLPRAGAHEVWVYRVDGQYVVDRGELSPEHDQVVRADHVSLVNVAEGVPVTADLTLPSAAAFDFTVRVTFACTVTDPARAVREDMNAGAAILAYLRRDSKLGHLALTYHMDDLNALRRDATARIRAYTEVKPPDVRGMRMSFVGVEVLTPQEKAAFEEQRRKAETEHLLETQRRGYRYDDEIDDERHAQHLAGRRREGKHLAEQEEQEHTHVAAVRQQRHEQRLQAEKLEFARREVEFAFEAYGTDPVKALIFAQASGEIDARQLAEQMQLVSKEREAYERDQAQLDREDARRALDWTRQDSTQRRREDREDRRERERQEREERLERDREKREDKRVRRREQREDRNRQLEMKLEVLRELAKNGHLDMVNVRVDQLVADLSGTDRALTAPERDELTADSAVPIESGKNDERKGDDDGEAIDVDVEVREEDD